MPKANRKDAERAVKTILDFLGEDTEREGLLDTPRRVIDAWLEMTERKEFKFTTFKNEGTDQMVVMRDIPVQSVCEHHMLGFWGTATVAYIPDKTIVGLSKLARCVEYFASGFQNQERITTQVAEKLQDELDPMGVAVSLKCRHNCMEARGVKTPGVFTTTTKLTGAFKQQHETRAEFLSIIQ